MQRHALIAVATLLATPAARAALPLRARVWVDAYGFARGETAPLRDAVEAARGAVLAAYVTHPTLTAKGYWRPDAWDLYWAPRAACERAWRVAPPRARTACVPGARALTSKAAAAAAAAVAFGDGGHPNLAPAIDLPARAWDGAAAVVRGRLAPSGTWAVKTVAHRGAGVTLHDGDPAATAAAVARARRGVVQAFVEPQARLTAPAAPPARFYVRAWALLTAGAPSPRAYMYRGGFAISGGAPRDGRVVNLWLSGRAAASVVRVRDLPRHVAPPPPDEHTWARRLEADMAAAFGAALAAAAPTLAAEAARRPPGALGAQLVGADFAVTPDGRAVLLEVNEAPSLARMGKGAAEARPAPSTAAFDGEKEGVAAAVVAFVAAALDGGSETTLRCDASSLDADAAAALRVAAAEAAAARATGWAPLAPAVLAGLDRALVHADGTPPRPWPQRALRRVATSAVGSWSARALAAVAPRALAWVAARGADVGVLGSPDPVRPPDAVVEAARWLAECA